jgi:hypothetical protein
MKTKDFKADIAAKCAEIEASVAAMPKEERDKLADTLTALVESMKSGSFHCICGYATPRNKGVCCKCHRVMGKEIEEGCLLGWQRQESLLCRNRVWTMEPRLE